MKLELNYCNSILILVVIIAIVFLLFNFLKSKKTVEEFNIISSCKELEHVINPYVNFDWEYDGGVLGKGKKSIVYGGIGYINNAKVLLAIKKFKDYVSPQKLRQEAGNQLYAFNAGLAPRVYDAFICDDDAYLVTDRIDMSVTKYLESNFIKGSIEQTEALKNIEAKVIQMLIASNEAGILHTDRHIDNIMLILNGTNEPIVTIIDWDAAKYIKLDDNELNQVIHEMKQTFDLLQSNLLLNKSYVVPEAPSKKKYKSLTTVKKIPRSSSNLFDSDDESPKKKFSLSEPKHSQGLINMPYTPTTIPQPFNIDSNLDSANQISDYPVSEINTMTPIKFSKGLINLSPSSPLEDNFFINRLSSSERDEFNKIPKIEQSSGYISPVKNPLGLFGSFDDKTTPVKVKKFNVNDLSFETI